MKRVRARTPVVFLLAVAVALAGLTTGSHGHDGAPATGGRADLPSFEAEHGRPDGSLHIESASVVDVESCAACVLPHRQRAALPTGGVPALLDPDGTSVALDVAFRSAGASCRLPAPRGPPSV